MWISKIPEEIRNQLIKKNFNKEELMNYGKNGKIGYLTNGEVYAVRYQSGEKFIFPRILRAGGLVGEAALLLNEGLDFELETRKESSVIEIPIEIFEKYILSDPKTEVLLLRGLSADLLHSTRAFYIRIHGGIRAYLAYLIYISSEKDGTLQFKKYSEIGEVVFSSRMMIYKMIREFEEKDILKKEPKVLVVKKRELLKTYFEDYISS